MHHYARLKSTAHQLNGAAASTMHLQQARRPSTTASTEKAAVTALRRRIPLFFSSETRTGFLKRMDGIAAAESKSVVTSLLGLAHDMGCRMASRSERKNIASVDLESNCLFPHIEISHHTYLNLMKCSIRQALFYPRQKCPYAFHSGNKMDNSSRLVVGSQPVRFTKIRDERECYMRFD